MPNRDPMTTLILGPVRSGKSSRAAALAKATRRQVILAATAGFDRDDAEMRERVARHRRERPPDWTVMETALDGAPSLFDVLAEAGPQSCVIVDALGTWLAAILHTWRDWSERDVLATSDALDEQAARLARALEESRADTIVVAEETGWGVVPQTPVGRIFRDVLGRLTRQVASRADRVELIVAGRVLDLRALARPIDEV